MCLFKTIKKNTDASSTFFPLNNNMLWVSFFLINMDFYNECIVLDFVVVPHLFEYWLIIGCLLLSRFSRVQLCVTP